MKPVAISVVIPNYNNKLYLAECLESVLRQTFKDIEILIVDDCSTDGSMELIKDYARKHPEIIRALFNRKNLGISRNRHAGVLAARGQYLTTLDSDDLYDDEAKLEGEYCLIKQHEKKEGRDVIAFSNVRMLFNDSLESLVGNDQNIREGNIFIPMLLRNCFIPRDFLFKRNLYDLTGGYNPSYKIYEDWNFKLKLAKHHPFYYTGRIGVVYRRHGQGLSALGADMHVKYLRKSFSEMIPGTSDYKTVVKYKTEFENYLMNNFAAGYRRESSLERAVFMLKCAMYHRRKNGTHLWNS